MLALLYGGLFGLLMAVLSIRVPMRRFATGIAWGDGGDPDLATRIRVFGNFTEYVPFVLLLMLLIEMAGGAAWFLHAAGLVLLAMRMLHAVSLRASGAGRAHRIGRGIAAASTWAVLLAAAVYAVVLGLPALG